MHYRYLSKNIHTLPVAVCLALLLVVFYFGAPASPAHANPPEPPVPAGFHLIASDIGIQMFKKDYTNGTPDYVQVIDLSQGAGVKLITGDVATKGEGKGAFGGASPKIARRSLADFWRDFTSAYPTAFCMTNGQFFLMADNPSGLSFPVKVDGKIITEGYAALDYQGEKLMFEIWPDHADIQPLSQEALYNSTAPEIIAGLTEIANKRAKQVAGRTFIGIDDRDIDGSYEIIYIFNTRTALQKNAAEVLRNFGADKVMMLDGGGSTQLTCRNNSYINTERLIPQVLGIWAGAERPITFAAVATSLPSWPVQVVGEEHTVEFEFKNTGTVEWQADQDALLVSISAWGQDEKLPLSQNVPPGGVARFTWKFTPTTQWGIYPIQISLTRGAQASTQGPVRFNIVVLPAELSAQREPLESEIQGWVASDRKNLQELIVAWTLQQLETARNSDPHLPLTSSSLETRASLGITPQTTSLDGIIWIPTTVLPIAALLIFFVTRARIKI